VTALEEVGLETQFHRPDLSLWRLLLCVRDYEVRRRPPIQSEFSVLKANLMAVPCIVVIFPVSARLQLDDPISSAASIELGGDEQSSPPQTRNPNNENEVFSGSAAAHTFTRCASYRSGANSK
jgi:hypothetical protein